MKLERKLSAAYEALTGLGRHETRVALAWISARLHSDFLASEAPKAPAGLQAQRWGPTGTYTFSDTAPQAVEDSGSDVGEVLELDGYAVVQRKFAVRCLIGDADGHITEDEIEWFGTRVAAEAFANQLMKTMK